MAKLSVVPWGLFPEASIEESMERTAAAGADAVELLGLGDLTPGEAADLADDHGIDIAVVGAGGETTGIDNATPAVADPDSVEQSVADIESAIETAETAGAANVLVTVGQAQDALAPHEQHVALVDVFREVAPAAESAGVTVVPEVLNTRVDHPGYYLSSSYEGYEIVHAVDSPNVRVLYDVYHQQITEGNVCQNLGENSEYVGHVHFADVPGRHEPGTGELNFATVFETLEDAGYDGYVGAELTPTGDPDETLEEIVELVP